MFVPVHRCFTNTRDKMCAHMIFKMRSKFLTEKMWAIVTHIDAHLLCKDRQNLQNCKILHTLTAKD